LYRIGKFWDDRGTGLLWVTAYAGTILPHFYFKTAIIDPVFNFFIFTGIFFLHRTLTEKKATFAAFAGLCIGLGTLCKGPVAFMIPAISLVVFLILKKENFLPLVKHAFVFLTVALSVTMIWLLPEILRSGMTFINAFIQRHIDLFSTSDAGHGQPFFYHPVVLFFGCFPTSVIFLAAVFDKKTDIAGKDGSGTLMKIMFWTVLIIFSIVKTKIVHYSSLTYFPMTYLAAKYLENKDFREMPRFWAYLQILSAAPILLATLLLPWVFAFSENITPYIDDAFAVENLRLSGQWTGFEMLTGVLGLIILYQYQKLLRFRDWQTGTIFAYLGMIFFIQMTMFIIVPKLEWHIQGSLIEFLKEKSKEKCAVRTINFKSYAQYFYAEVRPGQPASLNDAEKLLSEKYDFPVYIITKSDRDEYRKHENLVFLYEKGGFVFYRKKN
jgi:4-amino-4-deoxy-L-arabinose transferase-like glycosyltransferase